MSYVIYVAHMSNLMYFHRGDMISHVHPPQHGNYIRHGPLLIFDGYQMQDIVLKKVELYMNWWKLQIDIEIYNMYTTNKHHHNHNDNHNQHTNNLLSMARIKVHLFVVEAIACM